MVYIKAHIIYITITDRNNFSNENTVLKWITEYEDDGKISATNPYLVKINSDKFVLIWSERSINNLHYVYLDGKGNLLGNIYTGTGYLSDCQPIAVNGSVVWYAMDNTSILFYKIDDTGKLSAQKGQFADNVDIYPKSFQNCRMILTKTGEMTYEEAKKSYIIIDGKKVLESKNYSFNTDLELSNRVAGPGVGWRSGKISELMGKCRGINDYYEEKFLRAYVISQNPKLQSVVRNNKGVKITWVEEKGALGYLLERTDKKGTIIRKEIDDCTVTSWTDIHVTKGAEYQYSIKAYTTDGTKKVYSDSSNKEKIVIGELRTKAVVKQGEKYSDDEFSYKVLKGAKKGKTAQVSIVKYKGKEKQLFLTKKYVTLNKVKCQITAVGKKAFYKNNRLRLVMINIPIKTVGESAFEQCKNLSELQINTSSLINISKNAFKNCKKLKVLALRTKKLKASGIGKNIIKGTKHKIRLFAPEKKYKTYLKVLHKRGNVSMIYGGK